MTARDEGLAALPLGARPDGRTALSADWVLAHADGGHRLVRAGEVVIEAGRILHVGRRFDGDVARRIELGAALISPGLIDLDALSDLDTTLLGIEHRPAWAKGRVWPQSYVDRGPYEMYTPDELAFQKRFAFAQLLMGGITTAAPIASLFYREWAETVTEFEAAATAAIEMGLRVYLSPAYRSGGMVVTAPDRLEPVFDEARGLAGLWQAVRFIETWDGRGDGLMRGLLAPDRVETCTQGLLRATEAASRDLDCPIRLHMAQGEMEVETLRRLHGTTAPEWLASMGLLSNRLIAPHATSATDRDLDLYAEHGVSVVHCPLVSGRGGSVLRSFRRLRDRGITIAMGTDTAPADMLTNLLVALVTCRAVDGPDAVSTSELWDAATLGGAAALRREDLGRIAPGLPADLAVFALDDAIATPRIDPVTTLVANGTARVCRATFVDGRLSMRRHAERVEVAGLGDVDAAQARAQAQFDGLVEKYPERSWGHPSVGELFPPSYPEFPA